jgi:hypothetical protein
LISSFVINFVILVLRVQADGLAEVIQWNSSTVNGPIELQ